MKNLIVFMGIILFLSVAANAQQPVTGITDKGLKIGFGIADINTEYDELDEFLDTRVGFSGGAFLTYGLNRQFALQPEILYVSKGASKDIFFFSVHWDINYLEIPVLLKFNITPESAIQPNLFVGPALSILLSSNLHVINDDYDVADGLNGMDVGLVFGGGVDYKRLTFDFRYTLGLSNTIDAAETVNDLTGAVPGDSYYLEGDPSVTNTDLAFMLGFRF